VRAVGRPRWVAAGRTVPATVARVPGRRAPLIAAAIAVVVAAVVVVLLLRGGDDDKPKRAAGAEPLAYVPAGSAAVVFDLDTSEPLVGLVVEQLAPRVTHGALSADQAHALVGGRAAVALNGGRAWLAFATDAPAPRPTRGAAAAARDGVVVVAPSAADLRAAEAAAGAPAARYARATFDKRFASLPRDAGARVAFDPRPLLSSRSPETANTPWGRALREGAAVLTTSGATVLVPFRVTADPIGLEPADLPLATGPQPPQARGSAPLVAGLRDPAHTLAFARRAGLLQELDLLDQLPGFLEPDLTDLGPNGTVTSTALDLKHLTARFEPPDPGDWETKLARIDTLAGLAGNLVPGGLKIDHRDGVYTLTSDGKLVARAGLFGRALVLSNDPSANLRAAAAATAAPTPPGAAGALTARLRSSVLATQIPELIRARLGDLTAWARTELTGVTGELRLALR
jgi:hypothetical protein